MEIFHSAEFWVLVAFLLFVGLIWKPASKRVAAMLDERAEKIQAELDEAQRLREEAQALLASYQRRQRDAVKEAEEIISHAREEAEIFRERAAEDLETALKRREKMALDRLAQAESDAVQEVRELAVDLAVAATRKLVAENLDESKADELVQDAIKSLPEKLH